MLGKFIKNNTNTSSQRMGPCVTGSGIGSVSLSDIVLIQTLEIIGSLPKSTDGHTHCTQNFVV
jgi:hypothetical protein